MLQLLSLCLSVHCLTAGPWHITIAFVSHIFLETSIFSERFLLSFAGFVFQHAKYNTAVATYLFNYILTKPFASIIIIDAISIIKSVYGIWYGPTSNSIYQTITSPFQIPVILPIPGNI